MASEDPCKKQALDTGGLNAKDAKAEQNKAGPKDKGIRCGILREAVPRFNKAPCEKIIRNSNNSWIVLGRDRVGSRTEGRGGSGDSHCGMIDLVVGRRHPWTDEKPRIESLFTPKKVKVGSTDRFVCDAARIYISQKTDIDDAFKLDSSFTSSMQGKSVGKSGIGMKADAIRIIANEGIKLVTNVEGINSYGCPTTDVGIDLIANANDIDALDDLQPLVKGDVLRDLLWGMMEELETLNRMIMGLSTEVSNMNKVLGQHTHVSPFFALPTGQPIKVHMQAIHSNQRILGKTVESAKENLSSIIALHQDYLDDDKDNYILSRYNKTN
jgi:hypothetical protein